MVSSTTRGSGPGAPTPPAPSFATSWVERALTSASLESHDFDQDHEEQRLYDVDQISFRTHSTFTALHRVKRTTAGAWTRHHTPAHRSSPGRARRRGPARQRSVEVAPGVGNDASPGAPRKRTTGPEMVASPTGARNLTPLPRRDRDGLRTHRGGARHER